MEGSAKNKGFLSRVIEKLKSYGEPDSYYIKMRLSVEKITKEYEDYVNSQIPADLGDLEIHPATLEDLSAIKDIHNLAWQSVDTLYRPISVDALERINNFDNTVFFLAKYNSKDIGFILLDFEGKNNEFGVIAGLGLIPEYQRLGIGKKLGLTAWNYFKERNVKELHCEVYMKNNVSYSFIKSLGFSAYGRRKPKEKTHQRQIYPKYGF